jgi:hypothetical protein
MHLTYSTVPLLQLPTMTLAYTIPTLHIPRANLTSFSAVYAISNYLSRCEAFCIIFLHFLRWGVVSPSPNPKPGGPPLDSYPLLLFQHICNYCTYIYIYIYIYIQAISSNRNLRTRHVAVTGSHRNYYSTVLWRHIIILKCNIFLRSFATIWW